MTREQTIETMARAIHDADWGENAWLVASLMERYESELQAKAALSALEDAGLVVVPYGQCNHSNECKAAQEGKP